MIFLFFIALSLGRFIEYEINSTRDLIPRIYNSLFKIPNKGKTNWSYSFVPTIGPIIGSLLSTGLIWIII
ncbi:MIP family channel protein [Candidatus Hepatoplasma crinochetorum Av]|uniref:MIP family channel protein n=1 Tax=Candidatus Hepatoplasma crinochetorum Av TaxID=1427984 RepID=W8GFE7_9MOLU|nr:aquaporin [Candidatus Hepatoplasma crinochetorum]AHK22494.1 MIP family channel protein [Candidatus Hepatoplasma crinochetorum Av]